MEDNENSLSNQVKVNTSQQRIASPAEIARYTVVNDFVNNYQVHQQVDVSANMQRLYVATFDGTGNDLSSIEKYSNPAIIDLILRNSNDENIEVRYSKGVGTSGQVDKIYGGITGYGAEQIAEKSYQDFVDQLNEWIKSDPNTQISVALIGFSRGAATERHFANLIHDRGVPDQATAITTTEFDLDTLEDVTTITYTQNLIEPGQVKIAGMLLFDTVSTGLGSSLDLSIPSSVNSVLQLRAENEYRNLFDFDSILGEIQQHDPRLIELSLPGSHSDIGGGYGEGGVDVLSLAIAHNYLKKLGIPIADIPPEYQPGDTLFIHDSSSLYSTTPNREVNYYTNPEVEDSRLQELYPDNVNNSIARKRIDVLNQEMQQRIDEQEAYFIFEQPVVPDDDDDFVAEVKLESDENNPELAATQQAIIAQRVATSLQAAMGFFQSLESGDTRDIISSGVNLANLLDGYSTEIDLNLNGIANAINLINRIDHFSDTLGSGDSLAALEAGLLLGSSSANILSLLNTDSSGAAMSGVAGQLGGYLAAAGSLVSLVQNLQDGNEAAAVSDGLIVYTAASQTAVAAGLVEASMASANPYLIAAAIAISVILDASADEPYRPSAGRASVMRSEIYMDNDLNNDDRVAFDKDGLTVVANGTGSTDYDIFAGQLSIKWAELESVVGVKSNGATITQKVLSEMLENLQNGLPPGTGIIAERLPSLSFNGDHFVISIVNPESGELMSIAAPPGGVIDKLEQAAYAGQAVVPDWELATVEAKYQAYQQQLADYREAQYEEQQNGDSNTLQNPPADYWKPDSVQANALDLAASTRSVAIADLANDGIEILSRSSGVRFDMDDDSFLELTEWVSPDDALVAIDRNLNGIIDTGNDLFAGNFAWLDANNDQLFSRSDPAFEYMRFWQDNNSNGISDSGEMLTLDSLGVSEVYQENGSLYGRKENGEVIPIAIRDLGFDANGERRISMPDGGTLTIHESGSMVWSGGTVSDLSSWLTTGGGNIAGSPVVVLTGEEDVISDPPIDGAQAVREPRQVLRLEGTQMFNGPMVAIMALGLGVSYTSAAGMLVFNQEELVGIRLPSAEEEPAITATTAGTPPVAFETTESPVAVTTAAGENSLLDLFSASGLSSGIPLQGLSSDLQAMLAQEHFDFGRLGLTSGQAEEVLIELLSAQHDLEAQQLNNNDQQSTLVNLLSASNKAQQTPAEIQDKPATLERLRSNDDPLAVISTGETVSNEQGSPVTATVSNETVPDSAPNSSPIVLPEALTADEDSENLIAISTLLGNDYDPDGDAIQVEALSNAQNGSVTMLDNGQIRFVPNPDFNGQASFAYRVVDEYGASSLGTATINVRPVNDAPDLAGETITNGSEDALQVIAPSLLLQNDTDIDNDTLSIHSVQNAVNGSVSMSAQGNILFAPSANFNGVAAFDYTVSDGQGGTATAQASIQIAAVNDRPFAGADGLTALEDARRVFSASELLRNDYDVDGDHLTVTSAWGAQNGSVSLASGQISYNPNRNYAGTDSFTYAVSDGNGGTTTGLVSVNVASVNDNPYFTVGRYTNQVARQRTDGIVQATDIDGSDSAIRYSIAGGNQPLIGSATINATTGAWSFFSNNYNSTDANFNFIITATDNRGGQADIAVPVHQFGGGPGDAHPYTIHQVYGRTAFLPVVLDLDGDGIELVSLDKSTVSFDTNGDGYSSNIAWVQPDDGLLAWDGNRDSNISYDEISFAAYSEQAETDLQGLQAFDTNDDKQLTDDDAEWQQFVVWQDSDQNGLSDEGELKTLDDLEITAINLESDQQAAEIEGNEVFGSTEFTRSDGSAGIVADVAFDVAADSFLDEELTEEGNQEEIDLDRTVDLMVSDMAGFEVEKVEVSVTETDISENTHLFIEESITIDEQFLSV